MPDPWESALLNALLDPYGMRGAQSVPTPQADSDDPLLDVQMPEPPQAKRRRKQNDGLIPAPYYLGQAPSGPAMINAPYRPVQANTGGPALTPADQNAGTPLSFSGVMGVLGEKLPQYFGYEPFGSEGHIGRVKSAFTLPFRMAKGMYDSMVGDHSFINQHMRQELAYQLRGDETIMDNGDVFRDGKFIGNMMEDQADFEKSVLSAATDIETGNIGYGAATGAATDPTVVRSLGGPTAKKANLSALEQAQKMFDEGAEMDDIFAQTHWWNVGPDNKWAFEIDDSAAKPTQRTLDMFEQARRTGRPVSAVGTNEDFYSHPELYENYPTIAKGQHTATANPMLADNERGIAGSFNPDDGRTYVEAGTPERGLQGFLHEAGGHNAMHLEGRASGGNRAMFASYTPAARREIAIFHHKLLNSLFEQQVRGKPMPVPYRKVWQQMGAPTYDELLPQVNFWSRMAKQGDLAEYVMSNSPEYKYKPPHAIAEDADRAAANAMYDYFEFGEENARNVERRMRLTPQERAADAFYNTFQTPPDKQVMVPPRYGYGYGGGSPLPRNYRQLRMEPQSLQPTPRRVNAKGDIAGAPPGIRTEADVDALAEKLLADATTPEGEAGRGFYKGFGDSIAARIDDAETARSYTTAYGLTSNLAPVTDNVGYANTALNQRNMGMPVEAGRFPNQSGPQIAQAFDEGRLPDSHKAGRFAHHLLPEQFQRATDEAGPVLDEHMGTAFGYPQNKQGAFRFSESQTRFGDEVMDRTIQKGRARGVPDFNEATAQEMIWGNERAKKGLPGYPSPEEIMEQNSSFTQVEAMPGATTGVSQKLKDLPMAERETITSEMLDAAGDSNMARIFGTMTKKGEPGYSWFDGGVNPNRMYQMSTGTVGSGADKVIDPASKKAADIARHTMQLVLGQDGSGLTTPRPITSGMSKGKADIVYFEMGKRLKGKGAHGRLMKALEEELGPQWGNGTFQMPYKNGLILKNISGVPNKEFQAAMKRVHDKVGGRGLQLMIDAGGDYTGIDWSKGDYKKLLAEFDTPELRKVFDEKVTKQLGAAQSKWEEIAKRYGIETSSVLDKVRRIGSRGGMSALEQAVKDGLIPAGAIAFVLSMMRDDEA
jgi:hypothetical protein